MHKKIKRIFRRAAAAISASLAFSAAAQNIDTTPEYWHFEDYDIIVATGKCVGEEKTSNVCARIHTFNPEHRKIKDLTSRLLFITAPMFSEFGAEQGLRFAPEDVTSSHIDRLCGYGARAEMKMRADGTLRGTFFHPHQWVTYGIDIERNDENTLTVKGYRPNFSFFKIPVTGKRVATPPPPCF